MSQTLLRRKLVLVLVAFPAAGASAQQVAQLVSRAPDGPVRMAFAARAEVCGDGTFIGEDTPRGFRMYSFRGNGYNVETLEDVQPECRRGPVLLVATKTGGRITDLSAAVGVSWRARSTAADLGTVSAAQAATWLLDLAQTTLEDRVQAVAFVAANAADGARIADRLFAMARVRNLPSGTRARSIRWLSEAARREGRSNEADDLLRAIIRDQADVAAVRGRAIRELDATNANDAFLREAYRTIPELVLRDRIIRTLAAARADQNVAWIRSIIPDREQPRELRDRALRVLGEDLGRTGEIRTLYASLDDILLKDRALRVIGASGDSASIQWLREVALDAREPVEPRDRALRVLSEQGAPSADLVALYEKLPTGSLRQRLVRILAERGDDTAVEKVIALADRDPDPEVRRYALRRLSETRNPRARSFLENRVLR